MLFQLKTRFVVVATPTPDGGEPKTSELKFAGQLQKKSKKKKATRPHFFI